MIYNKANFRIHSLAGKDRYGGESIHVTPDYTEVTNGHYLIRVDAPHNDIYRKKTLQDLPQPNGYKPVEKECEFVLPANTAKEIERNIPQARSLPELKYAWIVENTEDTATFLTTDLQTHKPVVFRKLEGRYPSTERIMNTYEDNAPITIGFNPDYMMKICDQYKKAGITCVALSLYGLNQGMRLEGTDIENNQTITTILMPVKTEKDKWNIQEKTEKASKTLKKILED